MVKVSLSLLALAATSAVVSSPISPKKPQGCSKVETKPEFFCSALQTPLTSLLAFQANNVEISGEDILKATNSLIDGSIPEKNIDSILETATGGTVNSLVSGVGQTLAAIGNGLDALNPKCKCNLASCNQYINEAQSSTAEESTGLSGACRQAKYTCAPFYKPSQINQLVPDCKGSGADSP